MDESVSNDLQAAIAEADAQIAGLSKRGQQLAVQIAQQGREIVRLNAELSKLTAAQVDVSKKKNDGK